MQIRGRHPPAEALPAAVRARDRRESGRRAPGHCALPPALRLWIRYLLLRSFHSQPSVWGTSGLYTHTHTHPPLWIGAPAVDWCGLFVFSIICFFPLKGLRISTSDLSGKISQLSLLFRASLKNSWAFIYLGVFSFLINYIFSACFGKKSEVQLYYEGVHTVDCFFPPDDPVKKRESECWSETHPGIKSMKKLQVRGALELCA